MNINTLSGGNTANLSKITTTGTTTITSDSTLTFSGSFPNTAFKLNGGKTVTMSSSAIQGSNVMTVESESTLTSTAANVTGKYITGAGAVNITALESTLGSDLSNIDTTTLTATLDATGDVEFTATAKLSDAVITVSNAGTVTANASAVMPVVPGGFVLDNSSGAPTVQLTAIHADTMSISGSGSVTITNLEGDAAADLSGIVTTGGTNTVQATSSLTFTGKFPSEAFTLDSNSKVVTMTSSGVNSTTTLTSDTTLSADASLLTGKTIGGDGRVIVTKLNDTAAAALINITTSGVPGANRVNHIRSSTTFTGTFPNTSFTIDGSGTITSTASNAIPSGSTVTVGENVTLAASAEFMDGKTIQGDGSTIINNLNGDTTAVLANITTTGSGNKINMLGDIGSFLGSFPIKALTLDGSGTLTLGADAIVAGEAVTVNSNNAITTDAKRLRGRTIQGAGAITLNKLDEDPSGIFAGITNTGLVTVNSEENLTFTGTFPATAFTLDGDKQVTITSAAISGTNQVTLSSGNTLIADANRLTGKLVNGAGNVTVNKLDETTAADLSGITTSGTNGVNVADNLTFTGTFLEQILHLMAIKL